MGRCRLAFHQGHFLCIDNNVTHTPHAQHKSADFTEASMMSSLPRGPPRIQAIFVIDSKSPCMSHAIHRNWSYFTESSSMNATNGRWPWRVLLGGLLQWPGLPPFLQPPPPLASSLISCIISCPLVCARSWGQRPGVCPPGTHHPWRAGLQNNLHPVH